MVSHVTVENFLSSKFSRTLICLSTNGSNQCNNHFLPSETSVKAYHTKRKNTLNNYPGIMERTPLIMRGQATQAIIVILVPFQLIFIRALSGVNSFPHECRSLKTKQNLSKLRIQSGRTINHCNYRSSQNLQNNSFSGFTNSESSFAWSLLAK